MNELLRKKNLSKIHIEFDEEINIFFTILYLIKEIKIFF